MTGVVSDSTGAVIPGTVVTLSNPSTGISFTQTTDNLGSYRFVNVPPSPGYRVTFKHDGFLSPRSLTSRSRYQSRERRT